MKISNHFTSLNSYNVSSIPSFGAKGRTYAIFIGGGKSINPYTARRAAEIPS